MPPSQPPGAAGGFQPPAAPYGSAPASSQTNGLAVTSLVLGIVGLLTFWACGGGAILGIAAVVLGVVGLNKAKEMNDNGKGLAIGGIATGALAILAGLSIVFFWFVVADDVNDSLDEWEQQLEEDLEEWEQQLDENFGDINTDPSDGTCNEDRFLQDPDC